MSQKTYMYDAQWTALINAINGGDTTAIATALGQIKSSVDNVATAIGNQSITVDLSNVTSSAVLNLSNVTGSTVTDAINTLYGLNIGNEYIDITTDFDSGNFSADLTKFHVGNYIKKTYNGVTYVAVLADYNTFYNPTRNDYANINVPHWVSIVLGFPVGHINSTNTTMNGFKGSDMNTWLKEDCSDIVKAVFGVEHLKSHQCLLSKGTYNSNSITHGFDWEWEADHYTMLMSEAQLGVSAWSDFGWNTGEACKPLRIFQYESFISVLGRDYGQSNNNFNTSNAWLRDISAFNPNMYFSCIASSGNISFSFSSNNFGRFPIIILV